MENMDNKLEALSLGDIKLTVEEKATLLLRRLYQKNGFKKFNMARFEEYGFYAANRDFLTEDKVLTFTDLDGRLMALKPDVTLSIIKFTEGSPVAEKLYYVEKVYRSDKNSNNFNEVSQVGLEYIGDIKELEISQVVDLAAQSLELMDAGYILEISNMDFANAILEGMNMKYRDYAHMLKLVREKNVDGIKKLGERIGLAKEDINRISEIPMLYGNPYKTLKRADRICVNDEQRGCLEMLERVLAGINGRVMENLQIDLSIINDIGYYNGIIFQGYLPGVGDMILSGGQYDKAMKKFQRREEGIGFALYLDALVRVDLDDPDKEKAKEVDFINIALPKGRLADQIHEMLQKAGYSCDAYNEKDRRLILENSDAGIRYLLVKPSDVAVYVEHNVADIGIVGKDILMETSPDVYELLDLDIGKCKMCVAAPTGYIENTDSALQVATKYVNVAKQYYSGKNRDIEIIKLNGSIELGPILGLTDVIVDIVETGTTLKENNLQVVEAFKDVSARVIAGKHGFKFKNKKIMEIVDRLRNA